ALIRTFLAVRDDCAAVSERLSILQAGYSAANDKSGFYYELRHRYNATLPSVDPATFIFLNRTCWNGLYRVNRQGEFNVPYGAPKTDIVIPSVGDLERTSAALLQAKIRATTWENTIALAEAGDFVFLDPPYFSDLTGTVRTKYQRQPFSLK